MMDYSEYSKITVCNYVYEKVCMGLAMKDKDGDELIPTTNIGGSIGNGTIMPMYCAFIDTNNYPGIENYLKESGLATPYERFGAPVMGQSGWCSYPLYQFNKEKLAELDAKGMDLYEKDYREAFVEKQKNLSSEWMSFADLEEELDI